MKSSATCRCEIGTVCSSTITGLAPSVFVPYYCVPLCRTNLLTAFSSPPFFDLFIVVHLTAGANQRLGDSVCRRGRLLSREQRHCIGGQRGERPSLYEATRSDHTAEYFGNQELARDPQRSREYLGFHAGKHNYVHLLIILHLLVLLMLHD